MRAVDRPGARTYPHITCDPAVQGGAAIVRGTRVPVRALAFYWRETHDRARIRHNYPQISQDVLDEVLAYYEAHQGAIDSELEVEADGDSAGE